MFQRYSRGLKVPKDTQMHRNAESITWQTGRPGPSSCRTSPGQSNADSPALSQTQMTTPTSSYLRILTNRSPVDTSQISEHKINIRREKERIWERWRVMETVLYPNASLPAQPEVSAGQVRGEHVSTDVMNPALRSQLIHDGVHKRVTCLALQTDRQTDGD